MMKLYHLILAVFLFIAFTGCNERPKLETPFDTLKAYTEAISKKDIATMKSLLTKASIKMAQDQAKAQNMSVDEVIQNETLFSPDQKTLEFKNIKVEGDTATIDVKTSFGTYDRIPFIKEDGIWKIAKEKAMDELQKQADEDSKRLDDEINKGRQP
jgi:Domain of unknown function (DUF4878)